MNFSHWVNWDSHDGNVVFTNDSGFGLGSCESDQLFHINQKLDEGETPDSLLGDSHHQWIRFKDVERLRYVEGSSAVLIQYAEPQSSDAHTPPKSLTINFDSKGKTSDFIEHLGQRLFGSLIKTQGDRFSGFGSALMGLGILMAIVIGIAYFQKSRIIAFTLPILILVGSSLLALYGAKTSKSVHQWMKKKETKSVDRFSMATLCGGLLFTVSAVAFAQVLPDNHGKKSLYDAAFDNSLSVSEINVYLNRGASLDFTDSYGRSALWWSLKNELHDVTLSLLSQGASVNVADGKLLEHAIQHSVRDDVLMLMLRRGALDVAEALGDFDTQAHISKEDSRFAAVFERYRLQL